ncbi:MAG: transporter substrate-binding domain-containing protein [Candidatus Omnitrophica bacterium]|nr:transporter substrate-binding domain-containing protein [Candidatus Omnitrophota bacterium]
MRKTIILSFLVLCSSISACFAQDPHKLIVGIKPSSPFVIRNSDGTWSGVAIDLWRKISQDLNVQYEFREYDLKSLLQALRAGNVDVAVGALSITAEREKNFDFSHTYYVDSLSIALPIKREKDVFSVLRQFFPFKIIRFFCLLMALSVIFGAFVWFFERKVNPNHFAVKPVHGIFDGFWWAVVTMATVGYGDKAPVSFWGRLVGIVWIFTAVVIFSSLTATIASTLTVSQLRTGINGPNDLVKSVIGTFMNSTSEDYLKERKLAYHAYDTWNAGLDAVQSGKLDAFVYDTAILRHVIHQEYQGKLEVLPNTFEEQYYGLAFPEKSPLREAVNRSLLTHIMGDAWDDTLRLYFGSK